MSINSMTNAAVIKRSAHVGRVAATAGTAVTATDVTTASPSAQANSTLIAITRYIPTEILTLYVAVRSGMAPDAAGAGEVVKTAFAGARWGEWYAFFAFLAATPLVVWIVFATKWRAEKHALPVAPRDWPAWEMCAATIAYTAWAYGLPDSVFNTRPWYSSGVAAVVVAATSTVLGLISPLVSRVR